MQKSISFRLIFYILITFLVRSLYILTAFLRGFGSASNHIPQDIVLNVIFYLLNILAFFVFIKLIKGGNKGEFIIISIACLMFWTGLFFYYNYFQ